MEDSKLPDFLSHSRIECRIATVSHLSLAVTEPEITIKKRGLFGAIVLVILVHACLTPFHGFVVRQHTMMRVCRTVSTKLIIL